MTIQLPTRQIPPAPPQNVCLSGNLLQASKHYPIAFPKTILQISNAGLLAKLLYKTLQCPEVVAGDAGEEVVDRLELQTAVDGVQPRRTSDIHCRTQLALGE